MERSELTLLDPLLQTDHAEKWLDDLDIKKTGSLDDAEFSKLVSQMYRIVCMHPQLVERVLDKLYDLSKDEILQLGALTRIYLTCLFQYLCHPMRILPELLLGALDFLDNDDRHNKLVLRVERKMLKEYPYLVSLRKRRLERRMIDGALPANVTQEVLFLCNSRIHKFEDEEGVSILRNGKLEQDAELLSGLPPELIDLSMLADLGLNANSAAGFMDIIYKTLMDQSEEEKLDFLVHFERILTDGSLQVFTDETSVENFQAALLIVRAEIQKIHRQNDSNPLRRDSVTRLMQRHNQRDRVGPAIFEKKYHAQLCGILN